MLTGVKSQWVREKARGGVQLRAVVCGSFGDLEGYLKVLNLVRNTYGAGNVFPDEEHLRKAMPSIISHHVTRTESEETILDRSKLMLVYFMNIDLAEVVVVINEKCGQEYYGAGTMMELGYAIAKSKTVYLTRQPTNPNMLSLLKGSPNNSSVTIWQPPGNKFTKK